MANGPDASGQPVQDDYGDGLPDMPTVGVPLMDQSGTTAPPPAASADAGTAAPTGYAPRRGVNVPTALEPLANYWASYYGLNPAVFNAMIDKESQWNPHIRDGDAGEIGLGQVLPSTAASLKLGNLDLRNPSDNLQAAAAYLRKNLDSADGQGKYVNALTMYNHGHMTDNYSYANDVLNRAGAIGQAPESNTFPYLASGSVVPGTSMMVGPQLASMAGQLNPNYLSPNALAPQPGGGGYRNTGPVPAASTGPGGVPPPPPEAIVTSGAGGPSGQPANQNPTGKDAQAQQLAQQLIQQNQGLAGQQGRGWQMLALAAAMMKGYPIYSTYNPNAAVPRLNYAHDVSVGPGAAPVPTAPWENFAYRPQPPIIPSQAPPITPAPRRSMA